MIRLGNGVPMDERGVSNIVGIALLVGMVMLGALLVAVFGNMAMQDVERETQVEVAEQSMRQVASRLDQLQSSGQTSSAFRMPSDIGGDVDSEVEIKHTTTVNLTANENGSCTTGPVQVGTIVFENDEGETVGYEAGGIWRGSTDGGAVVKSPPKLTYRDGRLGMSISNLEGHISNTETISASINRSKTQQLSENVTRALYFEETVEDFENGLSPSAATPSCNRETVANITLNVTGSPYASAWHTYAHDEMADDQVDVSPGPNANVESGDTVLITFKVGDAAKQPEFVIEDLNGNTTVTTSTPPDTVDVEARINNTGSITGTTQVTTHLYKYDGSDWIDTGHTPDPARDISLDGQTNSSFAFDAHKSNLPHDTGGQYTKYRYEIDTGDDTENHTFRIGNGDPAEFHVSINDTTTPDEMSLTDSETIDAEIENDGDLEATKTIEFWFDGGSTPEATTTKTLDGGDPPEDVSFSIPTRAEANNVNMTIAVDNRRSPAGKDETTIDIGDNMYFVIDNVTAPRSVKVGETLHVNGTLNNTGELTGTQKVGARVFDPDTGTNVSKNVTDLTIDGTATGTSDLTPINLTVASGLPAKGDYKYEVWTKNDTTRGSIFGAEHETPYFAVIDSDTDPGTVVRGETLSVYTQVNNTGAATGLAEIETSFDGSSVTDTVNLDPGKGTIQRVDIPIPSSQAPGWYQIDVETQNSTLTNDVRVVKNESSLGIGDDDDGTITVDENITASLTILGTALTGFDDDDDDEGGYEVFRGPIEMAIYTDNETHENNYVYAWGRHADLNTPEMRMKQLNDDPILTKEINVASGTNLSVYAESFGCDDYDDVDLVSDGYREFYVDTYTDWQWYGHWVPVEVTVDDVVKADRKECVDRGDSNIDINQNTNSSNLVILEDGEEVPAYEQAGVDQRGVKDILQDKIEDDGTLNISASQRVLLYELSEENADPDNASADGDPDYNDAVVLFEVVDVARDVDHQSDAEFKINDTDAPGVVMPGDDLDVTVWNAGEKENNTDVSVHIDDPSDPHDAVTNTGPVGGGNETTVSFSIPVGDLAPGVHTVTVDLADEPNQTTKRNIYVGSTSNQFFLPNVESHPRVVKPSDTIDIETIVENVGGSPGTLNITVDASTSVGSVTVADDDRKRTRTLTSGDETNELFSFTPTGTGVLTFDVATENTSVSVDVAVESPTFEVEDVYVGDTQYDENERIVRSGLTSLSAKISNPKRVQGTETVELKIDADRDGTYESTDATTPVTLRDDTTIVNLGLDSSHQSIGIYDYKIEVGGDEYIGSYQIVDDDGGLGIAEDDDDDVISVDVNQIQLGG